MKKFVLAAAAAAALTTAAPVSAQDAFVGTQGLGLGAAGGFGLTPLVVIGTVATVVAVTAASSTN